MQKDFIELTANYSKKTVTIRKKDSNGKTYKKLRAKFSNTQEIDEFLNSTQNDIKYFLRSSTNYYEC